MFYIPQPYKCPKCGYEAGYSVNCLTVPPWVVPFCPACFGEWINANVPVMVRQEPPKESKP